MVAPVAPRDAATMVLARDGGAGIEIFMVQRSVRAAFAGGAYVFPGGTVTPEDRNPDLATLAAGRTDADASTRVGVASGGLAFWIAAIRECFEEAGVLLARHRTTGSIVAFMDPDVEGRFHRYRGEIAGSVRSFGDVLRHEDLLLDAGHVHYVSHWITPPDSPRRYDTRFFVAAAPAGQRPRHDAHETIAGVWIRPADALERSRRGSFDLVVPTRRNLEVIAGFRRAGDLLEAACAVTHVPTVVPAEWLDEALEQDPTGLTRPRDAG